MSVIALRFSTANIWTYTIVISYAYICIGSQSTLFPTFTVKMFGSKVGAKMFPYVYFFFAIANVLQWSLNYFIFSDDLDMMINILTGLVCVSFVLMLFVNEKPSWHEVNRKFRDKERRKKKLND